MVVAQGIIYNGVITKDFLYSTPDGPGCDIRMTSRDPDRYRSREPGRGIGTGNEYAGYYRLDRVPELMECVRDSMLRRLTE